MGKLINGKTPGEIKRILEWISSECGYSDCDHCQYNDICYPQNGRENIVARDALALIEHLEAQRDEAIKAIAQRCEFCKHWHDPPIVTEGKDGGLTVSYCEEECKRVLNGYSGFEWRGFSEPPKEGRLMKEWIDEATGVPMCEADCADEWLHLIWAVGCDYDGFNDVDSLKSLIDELVRMSQNARVCLREGKLFSKLPEPPEGE